MVPVVAMSNSFTSCHFSSAAVSIEHILFLMISSQNPLMSLMTFSGLSSSDIILWRGVVKKPLLNCSLPYTVATTVCKPHAILPSKTRHFPVVIKIVLPDLLNKKLPIFVVHSTSWPSKFSSISPLRSFLPERRIIQLVFWQNQ